MLYKKIKRFLISILLITVLVVGCKVYLGNKTHTIPRFNPSPKQEYKIDLTQFKIRQILNTNKIQSLEVTYSTTLQDTRYDTPRFKFLDGLSKVLTSRKLELTGDFKGIFSYDLSKAQFETSEYGTFTITLNTRDIESILVAVETPKSVEAMSLIGRQYDSKTVSELVYQLQELAKVKVNTSENRNAAIENTKVNLLELFKNVGVDTNRVIIKIIGGLN